MKYHCADGVNRDEAIDRYVVLRERAKVLDDVVKKLSAELGAVHYEMGRVFADKLGMIGLKAVPEEQK
jgi:hypothetical protein